MRQLTPHVPTPDAPPPVLRRLRRDERGMSYVFVGIGFLAFVSASSLAIDVGMIVTARSQAQNSADAAALAGAVALAFDDFDNRTPNGPAVQNALDAARRNDVMGTDVVIAPEDVTFPNDPTGQPTRVRAQVFRTVPTHIARLFGVNDADIAANATAEVSPANAMTCVKPFTIPDKWTERQNPPWDGNDTYDAFDNKGQPLANPDIYIPATDPANYTGYNNERERGERLVIRAGSGNNVTVSFYYSLALGGVTGGAAYDWNIANCNKGVMRWGDLLLQEPGNMVGPTIDGAEQLVARDPGAYWDAVNKRVAGSAVGGQSPRTFPIPLYDPIYYDSGKRNGRFADLKVANWIGFFLEEIRGNELYGRIIPIAGIRDGNAPMPEGLFPTAIRLVQ